MSELTSKSSSELTLSYHNCVGLRTSKAMADTTVRYLPCDSRGLGTFATKYFTIRLLFAVRPPTFLPVILGN